MLDQNTDRMWYVIGAVLIGAAIIFGMNTLMPEAFAGVSDNFGTVITSINQTIAEKDTDVKIDAGTNQLSLSTVHGAKLRNFEGSGVNTSFDMETFTHIHDGLNIRPTMDMDGLNGWNVDNKYKLSYTMTVKENTLYRLSHDVRHKGTHLDGRMMKINGVQYGLEERVDVSGLGDILHVELFFQPSDEVYEYRDRIAVYPNSGVRGDITDPVTVNISSLRLEVVN